MPQRLKKISLEYLRRTSARHTNGEEKRKGLRNVGEGGKKKIGGQKGDAPPKEGERYSKPQSRLVHQKSFP